jgi:hypothetical protein
VNPGCDLLLQAGHAHHKKLVQVGAHNCEKLHSLQQRVALILGFFQNPVLKLKQAEFPIDVILRAVQLDRSSLLEVERHGGFGHYFISRN